MIERSRMTAYRRWLAQERGIELDDYGALWRWSIEDLDAFWRSIWDYFGVESPVAPDAVLADRSMPGAQWFGGARLNYAEHVFRNSTSARPAIMFESELQPLIDEPSGRRDELIMTFVCPRGFYL